ncbi:uncharacterized protein DDB_G0288805-like isoform X2 [Daktulosphaira vitifoliae]|uniref:uncharacterized protein DDB_G0288805-like isoform X2 n=1 Tax=Daktulosphaira vitifoliae TaxID=58002 RepID=UPI0021A99385|nr:uncharacterized protein DDB_G0288805-like isoform X2 [Daktulosphaira vitifoliae]
MYSNTAVLFITFSIFALAACERFLTDSIIFPDYIRKLSFENENYPIKPNRPNRQIANQRPNSRPQNSNQQGFGSRPNNQWPSSGSSQQGFGSRPNSNNPNNNYDEFSGLENNNNNGNQFSGNQNLNNAQGSTSNGQAFDNNSNSNNGQDTSSNNNGNQQTNNQASSALHNSCEIRCKTQVIYQYNPVCGTNARTYQNSRVLDCMRECGVQTELDYIGRCVTSTDRILPACC